MFNKDGQVEAEFFSMVSKVSKKACSRIIKLLGEDFYGRITKDEKIARVLDMKMKIHSKFVEHFSGSDYKIQILKYFKSRVILVKITGKSLTLCLALSKSSVKRCNQILKSFIKLKLDILGAKVPKKSDKKPKSKGQWNKKVNRDNNSKSRKPRFK